MDIRELFAKFAEENITIYHHLADSGVTEYGKTVRI